ncbi:MAG: DNA-processing protein DprA [Phototrophicaceae bacterium]
MQETAWVALSLVNGVGGATLRALIAHFGSAEAVLRASPQDLRQVRGVGEKISTAIHAIQLDQIAQRLAAWKAAGVQILMLGSPTYPAPLLPLTDPPATLFLLGTLPPLTVRRVAVVGTRNPSQAAAQAAQQIGAQLAQAGAIVVSGLALGLDTHAHTGALETPNSAVIGVLGSGILNVYPPESAGLAAAVRLYGALLCEVAPNAAVSASGLVARNRIISGLADSVLIVETEADGGAMHAARAAIRQGRRLYALDLPASGNRQLIAEGAAVALAPTLHDFAQVLLS